MNYEIFTDEQIEQAKTDPTLQERIIRNYRRVAYKYAYKTIKRSWNPNWTLDDYYAVGLYGIYYAIHYYTSKESHQRPENQRSFTSLVFLCVKHQCYALRNTYFAGRLSLTEDGRKEIMTNVIYLDDKNHEITDCQGIPSEMLIDAHSDFSAQIVRQEVKTEFWKLIQTVLSESDYDLIHRHFVEEKSYREIEQETGIKYYTVRRYILKSLGRLKHHPKLLYYKNAL